MIRRFEDVLSWQKSRELTLLVYELFCDEKDYGFRNQIQRAAVSIMNNIAEGFERQTNNEFKQYLYVSKGSCGEVRSMLYLAKDLGKISDVEFDKLYAMSVEISKLLSGFIKTLKPTNKN